MVRKKGQVAPGLGPALIATWASSAALRPR